MWIDWGHTQGLYKTCTNSQQGMISWIFHAATLKILTFLFNQPKQMRKYLPRSSTSSADCFRLSIHLLAAQYQHLSLLLLRLVQVFKSIPVSESQTFMKPHSVWGQLSTLDGMWCDVICGLHIHKIKMLFSVLSNSPQPFASDMLSKLQSMCLPFLEAFNTVIKLLLLIKKYSTPPTPPSAGEAWQGESFSLNWELEPTWPSGMTRSKNEEMRGVGALFYFHLASMCSHSLCSALSASD